MNTDHSLLIAVQAIIENNTQIIRNKRVLLDTEVATLYQVKIEYLRKQVSKEKIRLPKDFMFQLTTLEYERISNNTKAEHLPYAFTESGIMMMGGILNTKRAMKIHIQVIEHFVQLYREAMQVKELINELNLGRKGEATEEIFTILQQMLQEK